MTNIQPHFKSKRDSDGRVLSTIHLNDEESETPRKVNLYKIQKGYALKANIDRDMQQKRKGDVVLLKNKEYDWFAGLQWRFEF